MTTDVIFAIWCIDGRNKVAQLLREGYETLVI